MNRSIKVLSIATYYFFPSLRQFLNSISKKWLFGGDPILEPIFDFCERSEPVYPCCILRNNQQSEGAMSGEYGGCGKTFHLNVSKYFFTTLATWGRALFWRRITLSCLYSYSGRFSRNVRLKRINCSRYRSPVMESPGFSSS